MALSILPTILCTNTKTGHLLLFICTIVILFCFLIAKKLIKTSLHKSLIVLFALSVFGIAAYLAIPPHAGLANYRMNWVEASFVLRVNFYALIFCRIFCIKFFIFTPFYMRG